MATAQAKPPKSFIWTAALIRRLRGKRTQEQFGHLVGAAKNTIWRWESGRVMPDAASIARLTKIAQREGFRAEWKLVGSIRIIGDIEAGSREIGQAMRDAIERSAREL